MAATLTKEMLDDLELGDASMKVIPQTYDITDTMFDDADQFFTLEGTLAIGGGEATVTGIKIDQSKTSVKEYVEFSDVTIAGAIPSTATAVYDYFYDAADAITLTDGITMSNGEKLTKAKGYGLNGKAKNVSILLESESGKTAIIYTNVTLYAGSTALSTVKTNPWQIPFNGIAKEATKKGAAGIIVLKA